MPDPNPPDRYRCADCHRPIDPELGVCWPCTYGEPRTPRGSRDVEARSAAQAHADTLRPQDDTPRTQNVAFTPSIMGAARRKPSVGISRGVAERCLVDPDLRDIARKWLERACPESPELREWLAANPRWATDGVGELAPRTKDVP